MTTTLQIQKVIQESMEAGYSNDPMQCAEIICQKAAKVFGEKLREQKVVDIEGDHWFVGMSLKFDSVFIGFRGKYFDTHINVELLDAGLEGFYYVMVTDVAKIAEYDAIKKRNAQNCEPPAMQYMYDKRELLN